MKKLFQESKALMELMKKENISTYASSAGFYIFLSFVPIIILICTLIPFTPITPEGLIFFILDIFPSKVENIVISIVSEVYDSSAGVLSIALLLTLWSAGKGVMAVMGGLNAINDAKEERNYFVIRILSSFYTLIMLVIILVSIIVLVFGNVLIHLLISYLPRMYHILMFLLNFRFLAVWFALTIIFALFYTYLPNRKLKFTGQLAGASFAAVVWSGFSWFFSIYVNFKGAFSVYGSLSIIVLTMFWLYVCIYILFMGACINKRMEIQHGIENR